MNKCFLFTQYVPPHHAQHFFYFFSFPFKSNRCVSILALSRLGAAVQTPRLGLEGLRGPEVNVVLNRRAKILTTESHNFPGPVSSLSCEPDTCGCLTGWPPPSLTKKTLPCQKVRDNLVATVAMGNRAWTSLPQTKHDINYRGHERRGRTNSSR